MKATLLCLTATAALTLAGCAAPGASGSGTPSASAPAPAAPTPGGRIVKSRDGRFDGEIVGTPARGSKFAKLQIGMPMSEVSSLIGGPDNLERHETGKRWIPFYFGNDSQRLQASYRGEGCLTYTGGNVFGGGGSELIRIAVNAEGRCSD